MREILFRGKRIDNGEWVEGVAFPHDNCGKVTMFRQNQGDGALEGLEVLHETVGQYTGLTDKNGKKIFEGDIVKVSHGGSTYCAKIEWGSGSFWVTNHDIQMPNYISEVSRTYLEIIGNIHDNPELLEVTK